MHRESIEKTVSIHNKWQAPQEERWYASEEERAGNMIVGAVDVKRYSYLNILR